MNSDDNENNQPNNQQQSSTPKGIYSTPELSVDANKISAEQASSAQSRVASIFANTDAGQRSQQLNNAMANQAQPVTEDVVIKDPAKKSKLPIVMAVLVVILVVVGVVSFLVSTIIASSSQKSVASPQETFNAYYSYLVDGPEEWRERVEKVDNSYFLFAVDESDLMPEEVNNYTNELATRLQTFFSSAQNIEKIAEQKTEYEKFLNLAILDSAIYEVSNEVLQKFVNEDANAAYEYINDVTNLDFGDNNNFTKLSTSIREYLQDDLKLYQFYKEVNCLDGSRIDYYCVVDAGESSEVYTSLVDNQQAVGNYIDYYGRHLIAGFTEKTNNLKNLVEKGNE